MTKKHTLLILTSLIISGCIPTAQEVTMRDPKSGVIGKCDGSKAAIDKCIDYHREKGYSVKSVTFKDE